MTATWQFLKLQALVSLISAAAPISAMLSFLDGMESHYRGQEAQFNRGFLNNLTECFNKWDDDTLLKS